MPRVVTAGQRRALLAHRHLLLPERRTDDVPAIADALVALHSSDPVSVFLSALVRMRHPSIEAVETALFERHTVLRHHAMRRTLWVATPDTVRVMHAACTRKISAAEHRRTTRYLAESGIVDPAGWLERAKAQVEATVREHGPLTARQLGRLVPDLTHRLSVPSAPSAVGTQQAHTRVLAGLGFDGVLVRGRPVGSWTNGQYTWELMEDRLPGGLAADGDDGPGLDERSASAVLAGAWLARFGPGTETDLAWWAGWPLGQTRRALADVDAVPVLLADDAGVLTAGWETPDAGQRPDPETEPAEGVPHWVALLPGLDPTVMGWKQRDFYLPPAAAPAWDRNGNAGPTIWADGRVVGAWAQARDGEIRTHLFEPVSEAVQGQVDERAHEVRRWLGDARFTVRFPGAVNAQLLGRT